MWIKNLGQVYSLAICLVASLVLMFSTGIMLHQGVKVLFPEITSTSSLSKYNSNDAFLRSNEGWKERFEELKALPEQDLNVRRQAEQAEALTNAKAAMLGNIVETLPWFFVALIFFMFHWSLYRRSEKRDRGPGFVRSSGGGGAIRPRPHKHN